MTSQVCVDLNIALKLVLPEVDSSLAQSLWADWAHAGMEVVAPPLFLFEGTSTLCTLVQRGRITAEESRIMLQALRAQRIRFIYTDDLHEQALDLALRFRQTQAYDAHYLALSLSLGCEFWTADRRLYRAVHDGLDWVRWLDEYQPTQ